MSLLETFEGDLSKMNPIWTAWRLTLLPGLNIKRETGELIRMFRMLDEEEWNVMVFVSEDEGPRYRDGERTGLCLEEAIATALYSIKDINGKRNDAVLA